MVRFPSLYRRLVALASRLSPHSRLRRALVRRAQVSGWAAFNRRDFELMVVRFAPDIEFEFNPGMQTLGLEGVHRGHEGVLQALEKFAEVWDWELEPAYAVDLGDRGVGLGFVRSHARASGVRLEQEFAQLVTMRAGLITFDQAFFSWDEGLRALGLDPDAIALGSRARTDQAVRSAG